MKNSQQISIMNSFAALGIVIVIMTLIGAVNPAVAEKYFTPKGMAAFEITIFLNMRVYALVNRNNSSVAEIWIRRVLHIGFCAINTPVIFILFGFVSPERKLIYLISSMAAIELAAFVVYLVVDRNTTMRTLDKINERLSENRKEKK